MKTRDDYNPDEQTSSQQQTPLTEEQINAVMMIVVRRDDETDNDFELRRQFIRQQFSCPDRTHIDRATYVPQICEEKSSTQQSGNK